MKKFFTLLATLTFLSSPMMPIANAIEIADGFAVDIGGGTTYASKYVFRGFDTFSDGGANGDGGAVQPYIDFATSVGAVNIGGGFWGSYALDAGNEDLDEQDYWFSLDTDVTDYLNLSVGYTYYDFINGPSTFDINEFSFGATLSDNLGGEGFLGTEEGLPVYLGYFAAYGFGTTSNGGANDGWYHAISVGTEVPIPGTEELPGQADGMSLAIDNTFGFFGGSFGFGPTPVDDGFAYYLLSVSTSFAILENMAITPGIYFQASAEDTVNTENEFWVSVDASLYF